LRTRATSGLWIRFFGPLSKALRDSLTVITSSTYSPRTWSSTPSSRFRTTRTIVGRANLIELYRGYGSTFFLDRCYDLRTHHSPSTSTVMLEYSSEGRVVATGKPYGGSPRPNYPA
jgi:hypothetical protein